MYVGYPQRVRMMPHLQSIHPLIAYAQRAMARMSRYATPGALEPAPIGAISTRATGAELAHLSRPGGSDCAERYRVGGRGALEARGYGAVFEIVVDGAADPQPWRRLASR